jgi:DeoR/GlpR family transcriptional regulator of sugar metabolism
MKRLERMDRIMEILEKNGNASTVFLARAFNVSESSIRRDISRMLSFDRYRNTKRVHGGIVLDTDRQGLEYMFELRLGLNHTFKLALAKRASELVGDGDNILIDSGTTCLYFTQQLSCRKNVKAIVLDIKIAEELGKYGHIESSVIGGVIRPGYYTVGGINALENLEKFNAEKVFMSADAIDLEHGITNSGEFEVGVKKKIIQSGKHVYMMVDYTKMKKRTLYKVADLTAIHTLITNKELDSSYAEKIRKKGVELILV